MKVRVQVIEVADRLIPLLDREYDLTSGSGLPATGDILRIYDTTKGINRWRSVRVIERHWNIGNTIDMIELYVAPTSEDARTI